jgi:ribosomal protein S6--L-glutamate ligase
VAFDASSYPFVLQPFLPDVTDIRVIVVGDYVEAYVRENKYNFRANLAAGGASRPLAMDAAAERFCREVMRRGRFPYAHIDLHVTAEGRFWLSEIALDGGIAAARIGRDELKRRKQEVLEQLSSADKDHS